MFNSIFIIELLQESRYHARKYEQRRSFFSFREKFYISKIARNDAKFMTNQ